MAIVEINAQGFDASDFSKNLQEQLAKTTKDAQELLKNAGGNNADVQAALDQINEALQNSSPAALNFSFVTVFLSLFYAYIIG